MSSSVSSNATTKSTKAAALAQVQALIAGTTKVFPNATLTFGNASVSSASILQDLQNLEKAMLAVNTAQSNARDAMSALRAQAASVGPLLRAYKRYLLATYGTATQQLAEFGLQPTKARTPSSTETRAAATAKLRATRAARGTKGKKQKAAIKGAAPVTAPATPPSPAGGGGPGGGATQPTPVRPGL
jgi:hypothetical protein